MRHRAPRTASRASLLIGGHRSRPRRGPVDVRRTTSILRKPSIIGLAASDGRLSCRRRLPPAHKRIAEPISVAAVMEARRGFDATPSADRRRRTPAGRTTPAPRARHWDRDRPSNKDVCLSAAGPSRLPLRYSTTAGSGVYISGLAC